MEALGLIETKGLVGAIEAADAELDASVEDYDDVLVVLLSDVATSYVQYRTFEQRIAYARANAELQRKSYQIAADKLEHGATTERDAQQAKQALEQTESLIPVLEIGKRLAVGFPRDGSRGGSADNLGAQ